MSPTTPKSVFFFYGDDNFSSSQKVKYWQTEFIRKYGDNSNVEIIDGRNLDPSEFNSNIEAVPFLSEKRLVIVKDFLSEGDTEDQKRVASHLEKVPEVCILVFHEMQAPDKRGTLYKKLNQLATVEEFPALTPVKAAEWVINKAKLNRETANYLTQFCGTELWTLSNELEKLQMFAIDKEITKEMIDTLCTPSLTSSVFKLTDAIAEKRPNESLKIFKILIESGEEVGKIFYMIARHFRILIQVFDMIQKKETLSDIARKLKQPPFVVQRMRDQAKNFTIEKLKEIYQKILQIDINVKTGVIKSYQSNTSEFELAVEKLIIECCIKK